MDQVAQNYLQTKLSNLKAEYQGIQTKYAELESDKKEHTSVNIFLFWLGIDHLSISLVINTLEKLPVDRKCYRMVGGVLVERTVGEVLPAVKRNRDGAKYVFSG